MTELTEREEHDRLAQEHPVLLRRWVIGKGPKKGESFVDFAKRMIAQEKD
jgi:broad specificity phosphatase PhoE